jgi:3-oxoacyl-[acyl-carrier protein] reductase
MLLDGSRILVTGGSRGIGRALCVVCAREGADVAFCYRSNDQAAQETVAAVEAHGRRALALKADVGDRQASAEMVAQVVETLGGIDGLVLNAGINRSNLFLRLPDDDWDELVRVNVGSLYNVGKPVYQQMASQRSGRIVAITSIAGTRTAPAGVPYAVTKSASVGFVKGVAREGGRLGIQANGIAVGIVDTDLADTIPSRFVDAYRDFSSLGRTGQPEEIAELGAWLLSARNTYLSGEIIQQDGGTLV